MIDDSDSTELRNNTSVEFFVVLLDLNYKPTAKRWLLSDKQGRNDIGKKIVLAAIYRPKGCQSLHNLHGQWNAAVTDITT